MYTLGYYKDEWALLEAGQVVKTWPDKDSADRWVRRLNLLKIT